MKATMAALKTKCVVGIVGGSDFPKINEQLGGEALNIGDFTFGENGLTVSTHIGAVLQYLTLYPSSLPRALPHHSRAMR